MFTVISIFCSNKWQARNLVFFDGKVRFNEERDKTRPEAQVSRGRGGGGVTLPETAFQEI